MKSPCKSKSKVIINNPVKCYNVKIYNDFHSKFIQSYYYKGRHKKVLLFNNTLSS